MSRLAVVAKTMTVVPPKKDGTHELKEALEKPKKQKRRKTDNEPKDRTSEVTEKSEEEMGEIEPKSVK